MANGSRILRSQRREPRNLKQAVAELIAGFNSVEDAASVCRARRSTLSGYANANQVDRIAPVDIVFALEKQLQQPIVTRFIARQLGYELFRLPDTGNGDPLSRRITKIVREGSKVFTAAADAIDDGKVTPSEAVSLLKHVDEAIAAFVDLSKGLENVLAEKNVDRNRMKAG